MRNANVATLHKPKGGLLREGTNPKTGRPWTLADAEVKAEVDAEIAKMRKKPALAVEFLQEVGILTSKGKLSRNYGG